MEQWPRIGFIMRQSTFMDRNIGDFGLIEGNKVKIKMYYGLKNDADLITE